MNAQFKPIYVIHSSQEFVLEEALMRLKGKLSKNNQLDYFAFDCPCCIDEALGNLQTGTLNLSQKIIVLNNLEKIAKDDRKKVLDYIKKPNPGSVLVMTSVSSKQDKSNAIVNQAVKSGFYFDYPVPKGSQVITWIIERAKITGGKISRPAAQVLYEVVGPDLRTLNAELQKLAVYCNGREITPESVEKLTVDSKENSIFNLVDAIGRQDRENSIVILEKILMDGTAPLKIFSMIHRQFRLIFEAKSLQEKGSAINQIARELRLPSFIVAKYVEQSRNFSEESLRRIFKLLSQTDYRLKTGNSQSLTLERMVVKCVSF